ncbi:MAG: GspH/FimT family pseudopilin [Pseudomonadota bacterium]
MRQEKGFTLIELMITVAILSVVLGIAVPSMSSFMDKRRVIDAAEAVHSMLVYARSEAIARSTNVAARIDANAMGVSTNTACNPSHILTDASPCVLSVDGVNVLKRVVTSDYPGVTFATTTNQITFDPTRGTVPVGQNGTIRVSYEDYEIRVIIGVIGRVRLCSPSTAPVGGYKTCPV